MGIEEEREELLNELEKYRQQLEGEKAVCKIVGLVGCNAAITFVLLELERRKEQQRIISSMEGED